MPFPVPKFAALKRSPFTWTSVSVVTVIFVALLMHQGLLSLLARRALASMAGVSATGNFSSGTFSVSYVTAPNQDVAKKLATGLVEKKLAACVNIVPGIVSVYEWKNEIQTDSEVLMGQPPLRSVRSHIHTDPAWKPTIPKVALRSCAGGR
ncbi:divalent-cation tolerance protein CutA isoform X3 [Dermacentor andersoni]|uniref:divalent-cation tolerance protein CutA isoform X3 n=1 Tax=Dermacentor andersoni TaxID=34620 RepID=UPI003B3BCD51